ncbi:unnamed protein product [Spirodela intermedia]|uniref:Uncharacterized protein n=1 Tax=Spirodela intermedia TaxID=51605 RepID=A0ABN7E9T0_SPIIN|nr:unnamed protein product [Spirodela intermedia]
MRNTPDLCSGNQLCNSHTLIKRPLRRSSFTALQRQHSFARLNPLRWRRASNPEA